MAEEHELPGEGEVTTLTSSPIPEIRVNGNHMVTIDLSQFFKAPPGRALHFDIEQFPEGLSVDSVTGVVSGPVANVPFDTPYLACIRAIDLLEDTVATEYFHLIVVAMPEPEAEEMETGEETTQAEVETELDFAKEVLPHVSAHDLFKDESYLDPAKRWELLRMIQYIINERYATVIFYDANEGLDKFGKLLATREAESGFCVYNFDNAVAVFPGEKNQESYGNRHRLLRTIEEAYVTDVAKRDWEMIGIYGSDNESIGKAWVIARLLGVPVDEEAPTEEALFNLRMLTRVVEERGGPGTKLIP